MDEEADQPTVSLDLGTWAKGISCELSVHKLPLLFSGLLFSVILMCLQDGFIDGQQPHSRMTGCSLRSHDEITHLKCR